MNSLGERVDRLNWPSGGKWRVAAGTGFLVVVVSCAQDDRCSIYIEREGCNPLTPEMREFFASYVVPRVLRAHERGNTGAYTAYCWDSRVECRPVIRAEVVDVLTKWTALERR